MTSESSGGRSPSVTNEQIIRVIMESEHPVVTTKEVAEELPIGERQTYNRLSNLHENTGLSGRKVGEGSTVRVWWWDSIKPRNIRQSGSSGYRPINKFPSDVKSKQQKAIYRTFQYIFNHPDERPIPTNDLKHIAWGADPETYTDLSSLWNNCVQKKLSRMVFFTYKRNPGGTGGWELSEDGQKIEEHKAVINFTNVWQYKQSQKQLKKRIYERLQGYISNVLNIENVGLDDCDSEYNQAVISVGTDFSGYSMDLQVDLGNPFWFCKNGLELSSSEFEDASEYLTCRLTITDDFKGFRQLGNKFDDLISEFSDVDGSIKSEQYADQYVIIINREAHLHLSDDISPYIDWLGEIRSRFQETLGQFA